MYVYIFSIPHAVKCIWDAILPNFLALKTYRDLLYFSYGNYHSPWELSFRNIQNIVHKRQQIYDTQNGVPKDKFTTKIKRYNRLKNQTKIINKYLPMLSLFCIIFCIFIPGRIWYNIQI